MIFLNLMMSFLPVTASTPTHYGSCWHVACTTVKSGGLLIPGRSTSTAPNYQHICEKNQGVYSSVRVLYGLDSQVALGALIKGRSASKALNGLLQRSVPTMIGSDMYSGLGFFPSSSNRADAPTRNALPPPPDVELPPWWSDAIDGDLYTLHWINGLLSMRKRLIW